MRAMLSLATLLPCLLLTIVGVVYAHILNGNASEVDTIQTWTCRYKSERPLAQAAQSPSHTRNDIFKSLCHESRFAIYGTLVVFILLGVNIALTMVTWLADKWAARQQRKEGVDMVHGA